MLSLHPYLNGWNLSSSRMVWILNLFVLPCHNCLASSKLPKNEVFFSFRGIFHSMFQTRHTCTYSCIGTSGKKLSKTPMRGFWQKNHCRGFINVLWASVKVKKANFLGGIMSVFLIGHKFFVLKHYMIKTTVHFAISQSSIQAMAWIPILNLNGGHFIVSSIVGIL